MLTWLADENFQGDIVRGLRRHYPDMDIVRVQDVGLSGQDDPAVLEWATQHGRLLLTHDVRTITRFAYDRVRAGLPMPGVVEVPLWFPTGQAIEEIALLTFSSLEDEHEGQVRYLLLV